MKTLSKYRVATVTTGESVAQLPFKGIEQKVFASISPLLMVPRKMSKQLGRDDYDHDHATTIQTLGPHLTAPRAGERLAAAELRAAGAEAALDRIDSGVIIVDAAARILFVNRKAETILADEGGLAKSHSAVGARDPQAARQLRRAIADCTSGTLSSAGGKVDVPREGRPPLRVLVAPAERQTDHSDIGSLEIARPVAILIVVDREQKHGPDRDQLRRRFGLTSAEVSVALEILKGGGTKAAAVWLGILPSTVRTHLKQIFQKTGAARQAELVRLLLEMESPAVTGDGSLMTRKIQSEARRLRCSAR